MWQLHVEGPRFGVYNFKRRGTRDCHVHGLQLPSSLLPYLQIPGSPPAIVYFFLLFVPVRR